MTQQTVDDVLRMLEGMQAQKLYRKIDFYKPYDKQRQFHTAGVKHRERLLRAGNQEGKTFAGGAETVYHLTGEYPPDWKGRRFDHPVTAWCAGEGALLVRDGPQKILCGAPGVEGSLGTGLIPREAFVDRPSLSRGVTDAYDTIQVRHKSGGVSTLTFKSYDQGREKFQSATLDFVWCDEEPPADIYSECLARIAATGGFVFITFTPLNGMSTVVSRFLREESPDRHDTVMTIYDAKHIKAENRQKIIDSYPAHERDARAMGVPMQGTGRIYPVGDSTIGEQHLQFVPIHWTKLWSVDFGISEQHGFAATLQAWDRDADVVHLIAALRMYQALPLNHAAAMLSICANVPVAWPQDGTQRESSGKSLAQVYRDLGLLMLPEHATWPEGGVSTETGIIEIYQRMVTGRFKVDQSLLLGPWGDEFRNYHRDEKGMIVKKMDDLMDATLKGVMMKRRGLPVEIIPGTMVSNRRKRGQTLEIAPGTDYDLWSV